MPRITGYNRVTLRELRPILQAALDAAAGDLGIRVVVGNAKYDIDEKTATFKLDLSLIGSDGVVVDRAAADFAHFAPAYGIRADALGKTVTVGARTFTIAGLKTSARTQPILIKDANGKTYKVGAPLVAAQYPVER